MTEPFTVADSEAFIQQLIDKSVELQRAAEAQQAALAAASASARQGDLELTVAPGGRVEGIAFHAEPAQGSVAIWSNDAMQAYRVAAERANRATADAVLDPSARQAVLESVPADVAAQRDEDLLQGHDGPGVASSGTGNTLDDLPRDARFEAMLDEVIESDDPFGVLAEHRAAGQFGDFDFHRDREVIEQDIRDEMERISARAESIGPEVRAVVGRAEGEAVLAEVGPWGALLRLEFRPPALQGETEQLVEATMATIRAAETDASVQVRALLAGTEFDDEQDPTLGLLGKGETR